MDMSMYQTLAVNANVGMQAAQNFESAFPGLGTTEGLPDFQAMLEQFLTAGSIVNVDATSDQAGLSESILGMMDLSDGESFQSLIPNLLQANIQNLMWNTDTQSTGEKSDSYPLFAGLTNFDALKAMEEQGLANANSIADTFSKNASASTQLIQSAVKAQTDMANDILSKISTEMKQRFENAENAAAQMFPMMNAMFTPQAQQMTENTEAAAEIIPSEIIAEEIPTATVFKPQMQAAAENMTADSFKEFTKADVTSDESVVSDFEKVLNENADERKNMPLRTGTEKEAIPMEMRETEAPKEPKSVMNFETEKPMQTQLPQEEQIFAAEAKDSMSKIEAAPKALKKEDFETVQNLAAGETEKSMETVETRPMAEPQKAAPQFVQVSDRVEKALAAGENEFTMTLAPEGLGEITVKLAKAGEKLSITIAAANPETHKLLVSQSEKLAQNLGLSNIRVESVKVETEIGREEIVTAGAAEQNFDASADTANGQSKDQGRNAFHANHHSMADAKETASLEEMSETYRMLKDRIGMLNYLA